VSNRRLIQLAGLLFFASVFATQCSNAPPAGSSPAAATTAAAPAAGPALFGPMAPVVSVKELMQYMIDPISDNIFDAVYWDTTKAGTVKHQPKTDEDWDRVKTGAVSLAEGIYLLKVPRPFAPPGDVNNSTGAHPPELSPTQITEKVAKDPVLWEAKIQALRNSALEINDVVKKRDPDALFVAMQDVDEACEACHLEYWYPGDAAAVAADKKKRARFEKPGAPAGRNGTPAKP
jgi:cytochrome c556